MCPFSPNHTRSSPRHFGGQKCPSARHRARGRAREAPGLPLAFLTEDPTLAAEDSSEALPPDRGKGYPSAPLPTHTHTNALAVSFSSSFPLGRTGRADKPLRTLGRPCALSARSGEAEAAGPPRPLRSLRAAPSSLEEWAWPPPLPEELGAPARPGALGRAERACALPQEGAAELKIACRRLRF